MSRSQQLVDVLKAVIVNDVLSPSPTVSFFLTHDFKGGWEAWLQVVYARAILESNLQMADFEREVPYPNSRQKCDLRFIPARGAGIWVELKTQRSSVYRNTVNDFHDDIVKLGGIDDAEVRLVAAVLRVSQADRKSLKDLSMMRSAGEFRYWRLNENTTWTDVTMPSDMLTIAEGSPLLATWRWPK